MGYREKTNRALVKDGLMIDNADYNKFVARLKYHIESRIAMGIIERGWINFKSIDPTHPTQAEVLVNDGENKCYTWAVMMKDNEMTHKVFGDG